MKSNRLIMAVILSIFLWGITTTNLMASPCTGFLTYTQGGWGADPHGNNPGVYLQNNFAAAFPNGLTIGCGSNTLVLTSSSTVNDFLPSGGTPSTLPAGMLTDPGQAYSNTFAGQLVAVTLNVVFDQYDSTFSSNSIHVADLIVQSGPFTGQTVSQVIAEANSVIGGCSTSYTVDDLNTALDDINSNYDNGTSDEGFLSCSSGCTLSLNGTSKNVTCYGSANGSIDVTASGAQSSVSYLWNDGSTTQDRSGLAPGNYSVTATDQGGCPASDTFSISQPDSIHLSQTHVNVSVTGGSDGSIDLTVSGGTSPYSYLWSNGDTTQDLSGLTAGTYSVAVADKNGCKDGLSVIVTQPNCSLSLDGTPANVTCYGSANGSIDVTVSGAQSSVSYLWNDGSTTQDRSGLAPGNYSVTATDQGGCPASDTFSISQPDSIHLSQTHVNVSVTGGSDGSINLTVTGGTSPYTYLWNDGATTEDRTGLTAGTYSVTVTDAASCQDGLSVIITEPTCQCVPPTGLTIDSISPKKAQLCWNSISCATAYIVKWGIEPKHPWQYRTTTSTCTIFTNKYPLSYDIYVATICSNGDTSAYSPLFVFHCYKTGKRNRLGDYATDVNLQVFPNPVANHLTVSFDLGDYSNDNYSVVIYNSVGQIVKSMNGALTDGTMKQELDLDAPSGIYYLAVVVNGYRYNKQIIIQR